MSACDFFANFGAHYLCIKGRDKIKYCTDHEVMQNSKLYSKKFELDIPLRAELVLIQNGACSFKILLVLSQPKSIELLH